MSFARPRFIANTTSAAEPSRDNEDLRKAADVLNAGSRVAILIGAGAQNAADEVIAIAERLDAGVAKALLGKAVLPDEQAADK